MIENPEPRKKITHCPECETPLLNIVSGAICPKGCGKIYPFVTEAEDKLAVLSCRSELLPSALTLFTVETGDGFHFVDVFHIEGKDKNGVQLHPGLWRRVRITSSKPERTADREHVRAIHDGTSLEFARDVKLENLIIEAVTGDPVEEGDG